MRLIGFDDGGTTRIGVLVGDKLAPIAEASAFYANLAKSLEAARAAKSGTLELKGLKERPAVTPAARVICVGLNYRAHAAEGGMQVPDYPTIFGRWTASLVAGGTPVPVVEERMDWEGELAVIIGKPMFKVSEADALKGVLGYACFNDISARTYQRHTSQFTPGKNSEKSGPIGPIVTTDEAGDPAEGWRVQTRVNGQVMQDNNTSNMVFSVPRIVSYLSEVMTLNPGDVIATGTPEGVGYARKPPVFLKPGDTVEIEIGKLGILRNPMTECPAPTRL